MIAYIICLHMLLYCIVLHILLHIVLKKETPILVVCIYRYLEVPISFESQFFLLFNSGVLTSSKSISLLLFFLQTFFFLETCCVACFANGLCSAACTLDNLEQCSLASSSNKLWYLGIGVWWKKNRWGQEEGSNVARN